MERFPTDVIVIRESEYLFDIPIEVCHELARLGWAVTETFLINNERYRMLVRNAPEVLE